MKLQRPGKNSAINQVRTKQTKRQLEAVAKWEQSYNGTIVWPPGTGKTNIAIQAIKKYFVNGVPPVFATDPKMVNVKVLVISPSSVIVDDTWIPRLHKHNISLEPSFIKVITIDALVSQNKEIKCNLLILDEVHKYRTAPRVRAIGKVKTDMTMAITATPGDMHNTLKARLPVIDKLDSKEAVESGFIMGVTRLLMPIDLEDTAYLIYKRQTEIIAQLLGRFDNNLGNAVECCYGKNIGKKRVPPYTMATHRASKLGWDGDPSHEYSPSSLMNAAKTLMKAIDLRKKILFKSKAKLELISKLIRHDKFKDLKIIVFSQSNDFLDMVYEANKDICAIYHSGLKTIVLEDQLTKLGNPKKIGPTKLKRMALDDIRSGKKQVLLAGQVLDQGLDLPELNVAILTSFTSKEKQQIQRTGRITRLDDSIEKGYNIIMYLKDTQEEKWLAESGANGISINFDMLSEDLSNVKQHKIMIF